MFLTHLFLHSITYDMWSSTSVLFKLELCLMCECCVL